MMTEDDDKEYDADDDENNADDDDADHDDDALISPKNTLITTVIALLYIQSYSTTVRTLFFVYATLVPLHLNS